MEEISFSMLKTKEKLFHNWAQGGPRPNSTEEPVKYVKTAHTWIYGHVEIL